MSRPHYSFEPNLDFKNSPLGPQKACIRAFKNLLSNSFVALIVHLALVFIRMKLIVRRIGWKCSKSQEIFKKWRG